MKYLLTTLTLLALAGSVDASDKKARGQAAWAVAVATVKTSDEMAEKPTTQGTLYYAPLQRPYTSQPCTTGT